MITRDRKKGKSKKLKVVIIFFKEKKIYMSTTPSLENELHKALSSWMKTSQFLQVKEKYFLFSHVANSL